MQKVSLEEEIELIDGIFYDIDFSLDFSTVYWEGSLLDDFPTADIIRAILQTEEVYKNDTPVDDGWRNSQNFWSSVKKFEKKEQRKEEKWENRKRKPKNQEEAWKNFERASKN